MFNSKVVIVVIIFETINAEGVFKMSAAVECVYFKVSNDIL